VTPSIGIKGMTSAAPMRGVRALMLGEVDQLGGPSDAANGGFLNGIAFADHGNDAAVVIGIHLAVEEIRRREFSWLR